MAVQNKNQEMAAYLKALEPEEWHNEQEKVRQLMPYKLPAKLVEYLKTGPLRLEFPERELVKWAELYPYMDVQEITWKRKKLLSLMAKMDNYSDYLLLWNSRDKKLWYLDIEHEEFHPLAKWEEFITDPGKYLNGMIEGEFENDERSQMTKEQFISLWNADNWETKSHGSTLRLTGQGWNSISMCPLTSSSCPAGGWLRHLLIQGGYPMALKLNFREITPEDTEILRMVALRKEKAEDHLCCDVTNEDGVTQTTWYSKADVALWGEDYIRAHTTMKYSDYTGWIISLDMEPWNDAQASPRKKKKRASFSPNSYLAGGPCQGTETKAPAHRDPLFCCWQ